MPSMMMIKQKNLSEVNQSKLIPEIGDTVQVTPTGIKTRIDLAENPQLKDALLMMAATANKNSSNAAVGENGNSSTTTTDKKDEKDNTSSCTNNEVVPSSSNNNDVVPATTAVAKAEGSNNSASTVTHAASTNSAHKTSSIWEAQQEKTLEWERTLANFASAHMMNISCSSSSSSTGGGGVGATGLVAPPTMLLPKVMPFPKTSKEVSARGGGGGNSTATTSAGSSTNTNSALASLKPSTRGGVNLLFTMKKKKELKKKNGNDDGEMTFAFTEDAAPATTAASSGEKEKENESEWDFSSVKLFEHPNFTAKMKKLKDVIVDENKKETDDDDKYNTYNNNFSTLSLLSEDRVKAHFERDRKILQDLEKDEGRHLFIIIRFDNLLFGLALPVVDYDILNMNNNSNSNNNTPSFLCRIFVGQRVTLKVPSEDDNMKKFKADAKLCFPELNYTCQDITTTTTEEDNKNNQNKNNKEPIYYSFSSPTLVSKIFELSLPTTTGSNNTSNTTTNNNNGLCTNIFGTVVDIRRHVKFSTQFVVCVLVDLPPTIEDPSNTGNVPLSKSPLFSPFLQVSQTTPRFFVTCHASELNQLSLPSSITNVSTTTVPPLITSTSTTNGATRRERTATDNTSEKSPKNSAKNTNTASAKNNAGDAAAPTTSATVTTAATTNQQQPTQQQLDYQKLLKTVYGGNEVSPDDALRIISEGVPDKQETFNAHVFRSKFFNRNPTTVLRSALNLHNVLIGPQSGGGQFRRMYGTGIGAWALNNVHHQQQQQQLAKQQQPQSGNNNKAASSSHAAKMFS